MDEKLLFLTSRDSGLPRDLNSPHTAAHVCKLQMKKRKSKLINIKTVSKFWLYQKRNHKLKELKAIFK